MPENEAEADPWLDLTQLPKPEALVTVMYPAMVNFPVDAVALAKDLCKEAGLKVNLPWGFRFRHESEPNRLLMKPLETEDRRGIPLTMNRKGNRGKLNLRPVYQAYHFATYSQAFARVPVRIEKHPEFGTVLAFLYGEQTLHPTRPRVRKGKPPAPGAPEV